MAQYALSVIPTIGLVPITCIATDLLANRLVADGTKGFFWSSDGTTLYYDAGSWVPVGGSGSGLFILNQTAVIQPASFYINGSMFADGIGASISVRNFANGVQLYVYGQSPGFANGANMAFDINAGGQVWTWGTGRGAGATNMGLYDQTAGLLALDIAITTGNILAVGQITAPRFIGSATAIRSATTDVDVSGSAAPTVGQVLTAVDGTHATFQAAPAPINNVSIASQAIGASTEAVITGARIAVPVGKIRIGTTMSTIFAVTKTGSGAVSWNIKLHIGTAGTTADAIILSFAGFVETAAIDTLWGELLLNFRGPLSASCVVAGALYLTHVNAATGFLTQQVYVETQTGTFNATTANLFISPTIFTGAGDSYTVINAVSITQNL